MFFIQQLFFSRLWVKSEEVTKTCIVFKTLVFFNFCICEASLENLFGIMHLSSIKSFSAWIKKIHKVQLWGYKFYEKSIILNNLKNSILSFFLQQKLSRISCTKKSWNKPNKFYDCKKFFFWNFLISQLFHGMIFREKIYISRKVISGKLFAYHVLVLEDTHFD